MASKINGIIEQINVNGTNNAIASTAYGYCETAAATAAKTVEMTDFKLIDGVTVAINFANASTSTTVPTLNINNTGAKSIYMNGVAVLNGWNAGTTLILTYDETSDIWNTNANSLQGLTKKSLTTTTINTNNTTDIIQSSSAGKFFGRTTNIDWVGLQISSSVDRFQLVAQLVADANTLIFRQNDNSSVSASNWSAWQQFVHTAFNGGAGGAGAGGSTTAGSESVATPVYIAANGTATPIAYTIGANVPIGAVFTDHYDWGDITSKPTTLAGYGISSGYGDTTNPYENKNANTILAGPSSGTAATPSFRKLVAADIPDISGTYVKKVTSTDNAIVRFDGTSGEIQNSGITIDDNNIITANASGHSISNIKIFSGNANAGKNYTGWIKFAEINLNDNNHFGACFYDIFISRSYNSPSPETYNIRLSVAWSTYNILQLGGKASGQIITHFRVVKDTTNHKAYFEYYVPETATSNNTTYIRIIRYLGQDVNIINSVQTEADNSFSSIGTLTLSSAGLVGDITGNASTATKANITSTINGIAYYSDTNGTFAGTGAGTSGQYLKSNGTSAPTWATFEPATVGLGNVENTKLSTWTGSSNITTVGTITSGTWQGTVIAANYIGEHTHSYLPLSGGTMSGPITFLGNQSSAWNDKGIIFTNGSRIGENTSGGFGIYAKETLYLRPNSGTSSSGDGIEITGTGLYPTSSGSELLGDSSHRWKELHIMAQSSGYSNGIIFTSGSGTGTIQGRINADTNGTLCFYGRAKAVLRPNTDATYGLEVTTTATYPTSSMTLGDTTHKWSTVYATNFNGNLNVTAHTNTTNGNKNYYPWFSTATSGNLGARAHNGIYIYETVANSVISQLDLCIGSTSILGTITLWDGTSHWANIQPTNLSANRSYTLPNKTGTIALAEDYNNISNNTQLNSITGTKGDLIYWSNTNTVARLSISNDDKILKIIDGLPAWEDEYKIEILDLTGVT